MLAPKKIRVNAIAPGSIEFPGGMWEERKTSNPQLYNAILRSIPWGRLGRPEEVANAAFSAGLCRAPTMLYIRRNSVLRAAPLSSAKCSGSSSPGWHTPLCGLCVPRSTGIGAFGLHHNE